MLVLGFIVGLGFMVLPIKQEEEGLWWWWRGGGGEEEEEEANFE